MMRRVVESVAIAALVFGLALPGAALAQTKKQTHPAAAPKPAAAQAQPKAEPAQAQAASSDPAPAAGAPAAAPAPGWVARCTAGARQGPLECAVEESAVMNKTGQLVVGFSIRVPGDTRSPVALIHLPLGLYLPGGLKLQVDDGLTLTYPLQTCDQSGCYVGMPIDAGLLDQMKGGQKLKVIFQNLQRSDIAVQLPLGDFAASYAKIQ